MGAGEGSAGPEQLFDGGNGVDGSGSGAWGSPLDFSNLEIDCAGMEALFCEGPLQVG
jgi:hypothetical protein